MNDTRQPALPLWRRCLELDAQAPDHYRDYVHLPLFELVAHSPRRVLDLGCATGAFGAELKRRFPSATVMGVEAAPAAAKIAATRLDRVVTARLEELSFESEPFDAGPFDTVIASDILEHLVNPWALLAKLRRSVTDDAQVLASIPNVRNLTVVSPLLQMGRFDYDERGLLDITHLRFFTLHGMQRLFTDTGYKVEQHRAVILPALERVFSELGGKARPALRVGRMTFADVTHEELTELCAAQFVLRARPDPSAASSV